MVFVGRFNYCRVCSMICHDGGCAALTLEILSEEKHGAESSF